MERITDVTLDSKVKKIVLDFVRTLRILNGDNEIAILSLIGRKD